MLKVSDLDYHLPASAIATEPAEPRDSARLMVVRRSDPDFIEHRVVRDLPELLRADDLMLFNRTRVLPARFTGRRHDTAGHVEGLFLHERAPGRWCVLLKGRRMKPGIFVRLMTEPESEHETPRELGVRLRLVEHDGDEEGSWLVEVLDSTGAALTEPASDVLGRVGLPPLPPYILAARKKAGQSESRASDFDRYQTVYAREYGSVAAPTAGLHFTPELLARLDAAQVRRADVVLHVGSGTFKPVKAEHVEEHEMHTEWCSLPHGVRRQIVATHRSAATPRPRVICVGTTTARTVESYAGLEAGVGGDMTDHLWPASLDTKLLITPGYSWRWTDGLLTNFHLPKSTLLAMVGSLLELPGRAGSGGGSGGGFGVERLKRLYGIALERNYRFFSYGDAMLILP